MAMLTSNAGAGTDFVLPDVGLYTFTWEVIEEPYTETNPFFEAFCSDYAKRNKGKEYDRDRDPLGKKERSNMKVVFRIVSEDEWNGTEIFQWFNPTMGSDDYPSKLRPFVEATMATTINDDELEANPINTSDLQDGMFQATLTHKATKTGNMKAVISAPIPFKQKVRSVFAAPVQPAPATNGTDKTGAITQEQKDKVKELLAQLDKPFSYANQIAKPLFNKPVVRLSQAEGFEIIHLLTNELADHNGGTSPTDLMVATAAAKLKSDDEGELRYALALLFTDFPDKIEEWTPAQVDYASDWFDQRDSAAVKAAIDGAE